MSETAPIPQGPESNEQSSADLSAEEIVRRGIEVGALSPDTEVPDQDKETVMPVTNTANKVPKIGGPESSTRTAEDMDRGMSEISPQLEPEQFQAPYFNEVEDVTRQAVEDFWENVDPYLNTEPDPMVIEVEDGQTKEFSVIDAVNITSEKKWHPQSQTFVERGKDEMGRRIILEAKDGERIEMPVNAYLWETFGNSEAIQE